MGGGIAESCCSNSAASKTKSARSLNFGESGSTFPTVRKTLIARGAAKLGPSTGEEAAEPDVCLTLSCTTAWNEGWASCLLREKRSSDGVGDTKGGRFLLVVLKRLTGEPDEDPVVAGELTVFADNGVIGGVGLLGLGAGTNLPWVTVGDTINGCFTMTASEVSNVKLSSATSGV